MNGNSKIKRKLICIRCPKGCEIQTSLDESGNITFIEGNFCKLGIAYVNSELKDPRRIVTTTVRVKNGIYPLAPVWTTKPVPKDKVRSILTILKNIELDAPVSFNQVVLQNVFDTGADVVTSACIKKLDE